MNRYDYRHLLQKAYDEGRTPTGVSINTLQEIRKCLENNKPNLNSVFGVGHSEEHEGELCVFLSDARTWKEEGYCADWYDDEDDSFELLTMIGLHESCDGVFQFPWVAETDSNEALMTREEIIATLTSYGLEYDSKFEKFMLDV